MNYKMVAYILGWILRIEGLFMLLPIIVAVIYNESQVSAYVTGAVMCIVTGSILAYKKPQNVRLYARDGFTIVALCWIVLSIFGAIPFVISGDIPDMVDALFETVAGFTTAGATIIKDMDTLSKAGMFWRCFTQWIGGMGIFVFIIAILPLAGGFNIHLLKAESPGPTVGKIVPRIRNTAAFLYKVYIGMTIAGVLLLIWQGVDILDAFNITFGMVGTGGFDVRNGSMAGYGIGAQVIVTVFMILCGVNFNFYFLLSQRRWKDVWNMEEVKTYFVIMLVVVAIIMWDVRHIFPDFWENLHQVLFQTSSILTTTAYTTTNFSLWPTLSKTILITMMIMGACGGSTAGGIKIFRVMVLFKSLKKELEIMAHPKAIRRITMNGRTVPHEVVRSTNVFIVTYCIIFILSALIVSLDELDFTTNFMAVVASLNNIGIGIELVDSTKSFADFSDRSKFVFMFDMLAGRLELFPMLMLFSPKSWKKY